MRVGRELAIKAMRHQGWSEEEITQSIDEVAHWCDEIENEFTYNLIVKLAEGNEFAS